jgi:hypothetical protein
MAERELFVPFPESMLTAPETTAIRSTTPIVSRQEEPKCLAFIKGLLDQPPEGWERYRGTFEKKG